MCLYESLSDVIALKRDDISKKIPERKLDNVQLRALGPFKEVKNLHLYFPKGIYGGGAIVPERTTFFELLDWEERSCKIASWWWFIFFAWIWVPALWLFFPKTIGSVVFVCLAFSSFCVLIFWLINSHKIRRIVEDLTFYESKPRIYLGLSGHLIKHVRKMPFWAAWSSIFTGSMLLVVVIYLFVTHLGFTSFSSKNIHNFELVIFDSSNLWHLCLALSLIVLGVFTIRERTKLIKTIKEI